jgi:hypothetical protein
VKWLSRNWRKLLLGGLIVGAAIALVVLCPPAGILINGITIPAMVAYVGGGVLIGGATVGTVSDIIYGEHEHHQGQSQRNAQALDHQRQQNAAVTNNDEELTRLTVEIRAARAQNVALSEAVTGLSDRLDKQQTQNNTDLLGQRTDIEELRIEVQQINNDGLRRGIPAALGGPGIGRGAANAGPARGPGYRPGLAYGGVADGDAGLNHFQGEGVRPG